MKPLPGPASDTGNPQRKSSLPDTQVFTRQSRTSSPPRQGGQSITRHDEASAKASAFRPGNTATPPALPPKIPATENPAPTPRPNMGNRPPGKGPKTFDEMGVPAQKQKDECVRVHFDGHPRRLYANLFIGFDVRFTIMFLDVLHSVLA